MDDNRFLNLLIFELPINRGIKGVPGDQMALEITDMDIEASSGCRFDYLEVRDGHNQDRDKICKKLRNDIQIS